MKLTHSQVCPAVKPWVPQDPCSMGIHRPSPLPWTTRVLPGTVKAPYLGLGKKIKATKQLARTASLMQPPMPAPAPCLLETQFGYADLFPHLLLQGNPAPMGQGRVPKQAGPLRPHYKLLAQQQLSQKHGGSASHQQGCREPWLTLTQALGYTTALC